MLVWRWIMHLPIFQYMLCFSQRCVFCLLQARRKRRRRKNPKGDVHVIAGVAGASRSTPWGKASSVGPNMQCGLCWLVRLPLPSDWAGVRFIALCSILCSSSMPSDLISTQLSTVRWNVIALGWCPSVYRSFRLMPRGGYALEKVVSDT